MKLAFAYTAIQIIALAILGFHEPLMLAVIPLGLIGSYGLLITAPRAIVTASCRGSTERRSDHREVGR